MALNPTVFQDNPQQPGIIAELYNPDQLLMGGPYRTEGQALISGSAVLLRGTVMGQTMEGAYTATPGKAFGTGTITVAQVPTGGSVAGGGGTPVGGDTMTINGTVVTFVAVPSGTVSEPSVGNEVVLPAGLVAGSTATADLAAVASAIASFLNGSVDVNISMPILWSSRTPPRLPFRPELLPAARRTPGLRRSVRSPQDRKRFQVSTRSL